MAALPSRSGISLKPEHYRDVLSGRPDVAWFEVHAENYMGDGGPSHRWLEAIRQDWPLSIHGVGMNLGSAEGAGAHHLDRLVAVEKRYRPGLVSEHLAWSGHGGTFLNDLLPLPYTEEALGVVARNIGRVQDALGRQILIENPSRYVAFAYSPIPEPEFLQELCRRAGCGVLLDINNIVVSGANVGFDPTGYLLSCCGLPVGEMHLAGHAVRDVDGVQVRIDDHGSRVSREVWSLFKHAVKIFGPRPTLVEWDSDVPALAVLEEEARLAEAILRPAREEVRDAAAE